MSELVIETTGLRKRFGATAALDGVDLSVASGEVHGFLGPNGAGKSTTIRVLLGLYRASAGTARVLGMDAWREAVRIHARIAAVPGDVSLWPGLTGGEAIDTLTRLRGFRAPAPHRERLVDAFELDVRKRCRTYSKGNRQKVALIAALATPAELYVLDEPTSGLDPLMEQVFREEVRRVRAEGATVLLSSHMLSEVEQLCDRVSIIRAGRIVEAGSITELRHLRRTRVSWRGTPPTGIAVHDLEVDGDTVRCSVEQEGLPAVLGWLAAERSTAVEVEPASLEEVFLHLYGAGADTPSAVTAGAERHDELLATTEEVLEERGDERPATHGRHAR